MMQYIDFTPNWTSVWTATEAEHELPEFKFKGPGWYFSDNDTLLVVPRRPVLIAENKQARRHQPPDAWTEKWPPGSRFNFHVYKNCNPLEAFKAIMDAPVRADERKEMQKPRNCSTCKHFREDPDGEYCASSRSFEVSGGTLMSIVAALDDKNSVCGLDRTSWEHK